MMQEKMKKGMKAARPRRTALVARSVGLGISAGTVRCEAGPAFFFVPLPPWQDNDPL